MLPDGRRGDFAARGSSRVARRGRGLFPRPAGKVAALALAAACVVSPPAPARAQPEADWVAEVAAPASGERYRAEEPLGIWLPEGLDDGTVALLIVGLDDVDVTPFAVLEGEAIVIRPPQPLSPGDHTLVLVQYDESGEHLLRGSWSLTVAGGGLRHAYGAALTVTGDYPAADGGLPEGSEVERELLLEGALAVEGSTEGDNWAVSEAADLFYYGREELSWSGEDSIEIGDFLVSGRLGPGRLNLGHHAIAPESLVMRSFNRRGASGDLTLFDGALVATGFAMRAQPVQGFREGLGTGDDDNRVTGYVVTLSPIPGHPEWLSFSGTQISGQSPDDDVEPGRTEGDAWAVAAESRLWDDRAQVRGEFASTSHDFDGPGSGAGPERDEGLSARARVTPLQFQSDSGGRYAWELEASYERAGPYFHSIANASAPHDVEEVAVSTTLRSPEVVLSASASRVEDNVDGSELIPTLRRQGFVVAADLNHALGGDGAGPGLQFTLGLGYQGSREQSVELPEAYGGGDIDGESGEFYASAGVAGATWALSTEYRAGAQEDRTGASPAIDSRLAGCGVTLRPWGDASLDLRGQRSITELRGSDESSESVLGTATFTTPLVQDRLSLSVGYQLLLESDSAGTYDLRTHTAEGSLALALLRPREHGPSLKATVKGSYRRSEDALADESVPDVYEVFVGLTAGWSGGWSR